MTAPQTKQKPAWLTEAMSRVKLVQVLDMAFDPKYTDAEVRSALQDIAEELGRQFRMPA